MKKHVIFAFIAFMTAQLCAQNGTSMPTTWRLSYDLMANVPNTLLAPEANPPEDLDLVLESASIEWSKRVNKWFEAGLYLTVKEGGILYKHTAIWTDSNGDTIINPNAETCTRFPAFGLGFTSRAHLLPLAGKTEGKWDIYLVGNMGGWLCGSVRKEYGLGGGVSWTPTKHFGLYSELLFGSYKSSHFAHLMNSDVIARVGLMLRF